MTWRTTRARGTAAAVAASLGACLLVGGAASAATRPHPSSGGSVTLACAGTKEFRCSSDARTAFGAKIVWFQFTGKRATPPAGLSAIARSVAASFAGSARNARVATMSHGTALAALGIRYARQAAPGAIVLPKGLGAGRPVSLVVMRDQFISPARMPSGGKPGSVLAIVVDRGTHAILDATLTNRAPRVRASALRPLR